MHRRSLLLLVVAVAAVAVSVWLATRPPVPAAVDREATRGGDVEDPRTVGPTAPPGGPFLEGTVRRGGRPEADVRVSCAHVAGPHTNHRGNDDWNDAFRRPESLAWRETRTGPDGTFRLGDARPGCWTVTAVADDGARAAGAAWIPDLDGRGPLVLDLRDYSESLRGVAVHADGTPFRGDVQLFTKDKEMPAASAATGTLAPTDASGRFRFGRVAPGTVRLSVFLSDDRRVIGPEITVPHDGEVRFVVDEGIVERDGRVVAAADGAPVGGARIFAQSSGVSMLAERVRSGADGRFRIALLGGEGWIEVRADGFTATGASVEPGDETVEVRLEGLAAVTGRVLAGADEVPVAGVPVFTSKDDRTVSDTEGSYRLEGLGAREVRLLAWGAGWVPRALAGGDSRAREDLSVRLRAGETITRDLHVIRAAGIRGRVLAAEGSPVAGVDVRLTGPGTRFLPLGGRELLRTTTGPDGSFGLDSLLPCTGRLLVTPADHPPGARAVTVRSGETTEVEIRLPAGRRFTVVVRDAETGESLPGARVSWAYREAGAEDWIGGMRPGLTDAEGRIDLGPAPEAPIRLLVTLEGYFEDREGTILERPGDAVVRIVKARFVTGRVLLPDGTPATGAWVEATQEKSGTRTSGQTVADGTFRLGGLAEGPVLLRAQLQREGEVPGVVLRGEVETEAGRDGVDVRVRSPEKPRPPGSVLVRVTGLDGRPVDEAEVRHYTFRESGGGMSSTRARDGEAILTDWGRPGEKRWLEVHGALDANRRPHPLGAVLLGPVPLDRAEMDVALPVEKVITGVVIDAEGNGVAEVRLRARPDHADLKARFPRAEGMLEGADHAKATTDAKGRFRLGGLGSFLYHVHVEAPRHFAPLKPLPVGAGATDLEIALRPAARPVVTVRGPEGRPVVGAIVEIRAPGKPYGRAIFAGRTDAEGAVRVEGLDAQDAYDLLVKGPGDRDDLLPVTTEPWTPRDTVVSLEKGLVVAGRVVDPAGKPVGGASVMWSPADDDARRSRQMIRAGAGGAFKIANLPPGRIALSAAAPGAPWGSGMPETLVEAGAKDVVLTVESGAEMSFRILGWKRGRDDRVALAIAGGRITRPGVVRAGVVRFRGVPADRTASLYIRSGDRCILLRDLRPGGPIRDVELVPSQTVRGRLIAPEGARSLRVEIRVLPEWPLRGEIDVRGGFVIEGVPPGTFEVDATGWVDDRQVRGAATVEAGGTVTIELK